MKRKKALILSAIVAGCAAVVILVVLFGDGIGTFVKFGGLSDRLQQETQPVQSELERLAAARSAGRISREQELLYSVYSIFEPEKVPEEYRVADSAIVPPAEGDSVLQDVYNELSTFSPPVQQEVLSLLSRRPRTSTMRCGTYVCVHYSDLAREGEYVAVLEDIELNWTEKLEALGVQTPLSDIECAQDVSASDRGKTDIYFTTVKASMFGYAATCKIFPETSTSAGYVVVDTIKNSGDLLTVVARHEIAHLVQYSYALTRPKWLAESSAEFFGYNLFTPRTIYPSRGDPETPAQAFLRGRAETKWRTPEEDLGSIAPPTWIDYAQYFFWDYLEQTVGQAETVQSYITPLWASDGSVQTLASLFSDFSATLDLYHDWQTFTALYAAFSTSGFTEAPDLPGRTPIEVDLPRQVGSSVNGSSNTINGYAVGEVQAFGPMSETDKYTIFVKVPVEGALINPQVLVLLNYQEFFQLELVASDKGPQWVEGVFEPPQNTVLGAELRIIGKNLAGDPGTFDWEIKLEDDSSGGSNRPPPPPGFGPYTDDQSCDNSGLCLYNHSGLSQTPPPACQYYGEHLPSGAEFCDSRNLHYLPSYTYQGCAPPTNPDGQLPPWENRDFQDGFDAGDPIPGDPYGAVQYVLLPPEERLCTIVFLNAVNADNNLTKFEGLDVALRYADGTPYVGDAYDPLATDQWGRAVWAGMPKLINGDPAPYIMQVKVPADHVLVPSTGQSTVQIEGELWAQTQVTCFEGVCQSSVNTFRFRAE